MLDTLSYIGKKLNKEKILWGVGASMLLNHYGIIDKPNDIDILVSLNDIEKVDIILKSFGEKKVWEKEAAYSTKYFYEYKINGIDFDIMAGLTINHNEGIYRHIFDENSIFEIVRINGISIPLTSLEDWYVIYQLIPNREIKVGLIESYFMTNGINRADLLARSLEGCLPSRVRDNIKRILK